MKHTVTPVSRMSGYRVMWMLTMFDLPVMTQSQRKEATRFRQHLLDLGFEMAQFSVYMRCCASREQCEALVPRIRKGLPSGGKVSILIFTDKQYEGMIHFYSREKIDPPGTGPGQLALF